MRADAELIRSSLSGDGEAFTEVVERHEAVIWAYLVRRAGKQTAEDLLAEVWLAAFESRRRYDFTFPEARPWLFGIAQNTLRRHWRSRTVEDPAPDLSALSHATAADPWPAQDARIDGKSWLRRALAALSPDEREVLFLVVWEQASIADAARALGIPAGTARRYLHQARMALRSAPVMVELLANRTS